MYTRRKFLASSVVAATGIGLASCRDRVQVGASVGATAVDAPAPTTPHSRHGPEFPRHPSAGEPLPVRGGTVIDAAPTYSVAEDVMGELLEGQVLRERAWLATKLSRVNGRAEGLAQFNDTLRRLKTDRVALLQVHNLGDLKTQLALARELKALGKVRYVGVSHYQDRAHDEITAALEAEKPDFVQINYSVVSRTAEQRVLPTARDLGVRLGSG